MPILQAEVCNTIHMYRIKGQPLKVCTLNAEVEAFIKLHTPGPQLCSVILYIGAYYGVSYPMGWFRLSASFDTTVLSHSTVCCVQYASLQGRHLGVTPARRPLAHDGFALGRHTGDGLAATLENILLGGSSKTRSPRLKNTHSPNLGARA